MSKGIVNIILVVLLCAVSYNGISQIKTHGIPYIKNYTIDDYKGEGEFGATQNWYVYQDSKGIMYFANSGGLLYFDGVNWTLLREETTSAFRSISGTPDDKIYVGGKGEFGYISNDSLGKIIYKSLVHKLPEDKNDFADIWNTYTFADKTIFETSKNLIVFSGDSLHIIPANGFIINTFKNGEELFLFDTESGMSKLVDRKLVPQFNHEIFSSYLFCIDGFNNYPFVISRNYGFYVLKEDGLKKLKVASEEEIIAQKPYCGVKLDENHIAIGTQLGGIFIIDKHGVVKQVYNKQNGLQANTIYDLYLDKDQNLWAALGNGISYLKINSPFTYFNPLLNIPRKNYDVLQVGETLYFSNEIGVHYRSINPVDDELNVLKFNKLKGVSGISYTMLKHNNLLIIGNSYGVYLTEKNSILSRVFEEVHFWDLKKIPGTENKYFGMANKGLYTFEIDGKKIRNAHKVKGFENTMRYSIVESQRIVWTTDEIKGIRKLILTEDLKKIDTSIFYSFGKEKVLTYPFILDSQLYASSVNDIYQFESNQFVIAEELQEKYNIKGDSYLFTRDEWGRLWIQNNTSAKWITSENKLISMPFEPFKGENISRLSILSEKDLYFPTDKVVIHYDPTYPFYEDSSFNVVCHSIININNDSIIAGKYAHLFQDSLLLNTSNGLLVLPFSTRNLRFSYAATYYEKPENTEYQIWLEGFENNNLNWTKATQKDYTNLKPGKYIFHVRAKNIYGNISAEKKIHFEITPPYYLSVWAYLIYVLIGIVFFYLFLKLYTQRLNARNMKLEYLVRERTQEIETQNEEILSQSEQLMEYNEELRKLSLVASEVNNAVIITDHLGRIEWVNTCFERFYGLSIQDVKQKSRSAIVGYENLQFIENLFKEVRETKKPVSFELEVVKENGYKTYVHTTLTPLTNIDNVVDKIIAIDSDITKLKIAEREIIGQKQKIENQNQELTKHRLHLEELVKERTAELQLALSKAEESDRLKTSFLMNMSHEIRTPMNAIVGFCELLENEDDPNSLEAYIGQISKNSESLLQLIDNIINLSRLESNSYEVGIKEFDLNELLNQIYADFIDIASEKNIKLTISKSQLEPKLVKSDMQLLHLTFKQLVQNALKYTTEGEVAFGYKMKNNQGNLMLLCFVEDTGIGMSSEAIDQIFKRFTKIEDDNRKLYRGAGIGLAICQRSVALLGGDIWVESILGKGTLVHFTFS
jgi:PAS domain S-box-containing protein